MIEHSIEVDRDNTKIGLRLKDDFDSIERKMERILSDIQSVEGLEINPSAKSKFKWDMKQQKEYHSQPIAA